MKLSKSICLGLAGLLTLLSASCGSLPEPQKDLGPKSEHSDIPWNRRLPGEGQGALGGFGSQY
ncbi:hypothetical protein SAMN02745181_2247 [Rubritalea squalenifaciens DSM 18772]|uniref:Uncharacterized protein n=2 Tax=Rubritalea TaxID=361050 RepID=A0A1M6KZK8_9BACT|nr:hypothetical protein [Rubritalea squalenifaciens]SHJ64274.1 hypothetical protein SAMN02745181_2247 [Rubritalea squalenifaciens DSM 18772]